MGAGEFMSLLCFFFTGFEFPGFPKMPVYQSSWEPIQMLWGN